MYRGPCYDECFLFVYSITKHAPVNLKSTLGASRLLVPIYCMLRRMFVLLIFLRCKDWGFFLIAPNFSFSFFKILLHH